MAASRLIGFVAGLYGAAGVSLLAVGVHALPEANLDIAGSILLLHAAALLALAVGDRLKWRGAAALLIALGCLLFSGDLVMRAAMGRHLFPMAAPSGGVALIVGWLIVALGSLVRRRSEPA